MKVYHVFIERKPPLEADQRALMIVANMIQSNPALAGDRGQVIISQSHGSGPAIIVFDLPDTANPDDLFVWDGEKLTYKEIKPDDQPTESAGNQLGESGGEGSDGSRIVSGEATVKRSSRQVSQ